MTKAKYLGLTVNELAKVASDLDAENAKLREQGVRLFDKTLELADDNARLRELMRDTYDCICEMYRYMDGRYAYEDAEADDAYGPILKRMRELGIEVGE